MVVMMMMMIAKLSTSGKHNLMVGGAMPSGEQGGSQVDWQEQWGGHQHQPARPHLDHDDDGGDDGDDGDEIYGESGWGDCDYQFEFWQARLWIFNFLALHFPLAGSWTVQASYKT